MNTTILNLLHDGYSVHFDLAPDGNVTVSVIHLHSVKPHGFGFGSNDPYVALCGAVEDIAKRERELANNYKSVGA